MKKKTKKKPRKDNISTKLKIHKHKYIVCVLHLYKSIFKL